MKILAIDTSTPIGSVAVTDNEEVLAEENYEARASHSEILLQVVNGVLCSAGLGISDVDGIAVAIGPGSFTGLRIGLATAKGLALASAKPLVGISSLESLALNVIASPERAKQSPEPTYQRPPLQRRRAGTNARHYNFGGQAPTYQIVPCIDAHRAEVYVAVYKFVHRPSSLVPRIPESSLPPDKLCNELLRHEGSYLFLGGGAVRYKDIFERRLGERFVLAPDELLYPRASNTALLALPRFKEGRIADLAGLTPNYIRKSAAVTER